VLSAPELDALIQAGSQNRTVEGQNHLPEQAGQKRRARKKISFFSSERKRKQL